MTTEDVINAAIPLNFDSIKCANTRMQLTQVAKVRRNELRNNIEKLLEFERIKIDVRDKNKSGMGTRPSLW